MVQSPWPIRRSETQKATWDTGCYRAVTPGNLDRWLQIKHGGHGNQH